MKGVDLDLGVSDLLLGKLILVTGGAGFIGSHLVRRLISLGAEVVVVDNFSSGRRSNLVDSRNLLVVEVDLTESYAINCLSPAFDDVDAVVHLAANASVTESISNPGHTHSINASLSLNLFEWAAKAGVRRIVFASSAAVYGEPVYLPLDEKHQTKPLSPYGVDKLASEGYLAHFVNSYGIMGFPFRFMNVYGPGQNPTYSGVLSHFLNRLISGESPIVFGDGNQTRDFIHVQDIIEAIVATLFAEAGFARPLNLGTGRPTSLNDLLISLKHWFKFEPVYLPSRDGEITQSYADISAVTAALGWKPQVAIEDGLAGLIQSLKTPK